jgi:hypothetical protein
VPTQTSELPNYPATDELANWRNRSSLIQILWFAIFGLTGVPGTRQPRFLAAARRENCLGNRRTPQPCIPRLMAFVCLLNWRIIMGILRAKGSETFGR